MAEGIYQPNSVDVLGGDGLVRYGRVEDVTDNGIFVDFFCDNQRRQFFTFDSDVFLPNNSRGLSIVGVASECNDTTIPVEVLMRDEPGSPWIWYPGEMLVAGCGPLVHVLHVVAVRWGSVRPRIDIIHFDRIRERSSSGEGQPMSAFSRKETGVVPVRVGNATFTKHAVQLPPGYTDIPIDALRQQLNNEIGSLLSKWSVVLTAVVDGHLWLIRRCHAPVPEETFPFDTIVDQISGVLRGRSPYWFLISRPAIPDTENANLLPTELWLDFFSHLNTFTQTKLRAVCPLWRDILSSPLLAGTLHVTMSANHRHVMCQQILYTLVSPICQCLTGSTKRIIVDNRKGWIRDDLVIFKVLDMIRCIAQHKPGVRLDTIYLVGLRCAFGIGSRRGFPSCWLHRSAVVAAGDDSGYDHELRLEDFLAVCRSVPCEALHWIDSEIQLNDRDFWYSVPSKEIRAKVSLCRMPISALEIAMWEAFEKDFPEPTPEELRQLADWLTSMRDAGRRAISACEESEEERASP